MIDLFSQEVRDNPYPAYKKIREAGAAVFDEKSGIWFIGRHHDVANALRNVEAFSSRGIAGFESTLVGQDGVLHSRVRKMIQAAFSPAYINSLRSAIETEADRTMKLFANSERLEFVSEIAGAVPTAVLSWMLGGVEDKVPEFKRWAGAIFSTHTRLREEREMSAGKRLLKKIVRFISATAAERSILADMAECEAFLRKHFKEAANGDTGGWIAELLCENQEAKLISTEEMIDLGLVFVVAATETTISFISTAVSILAMDVKLQNQLRSNQDLIDPFLEEVLRYDAPVQRRPRRVTKDVPVGDIVLPAGAPVVLLIGSANRDPERFPEPDEFRIDRAPNPYLSFGAGPHFCPGFQLGKLEARALILSMLNILPPFKLARPDEKIEQHPNLLLRGPRELNLTLKPPGGSADSQKTC